MNTPSPCDECDHLYYDCMYEDDPDYCAECKLELEMGNSNCPSFKKWVECFTRKKQKDK